MPISQSSTGEVAQTPIPYFRVVLLGLILAANNTSIWMIFSFLPFMVQHFFPNLPVTDLGYEAGMLGSAFSAGSLVGNVVWGIVSDRAGRRPTLLCGLLGTAISALFFGFAPTFYTAVFARFMWGLLNGNLGVAKTYLTEISDDSNAARGMAIFGAIGGIGRTIGPLIGGFLSSPASKYPGVFKNTIFESYPYALASLVISVNCLIIFTLSYIHLSETLPKPASPTTTSTRRPSATSTAGYSLLRTYEDLDTSPTSPTVELTPIEKSSKDPIRRVESEGEESKESLLSNTQLSHLQSQSIAESPLNRKKRVLFSGIVEVSVIGSQTRAYASLKSVSATDTPVIHHPSILSPLRAKDNEDLDNSEISESQHIATNHLSPLELMESARSPENIHRIVQYSNGADDENADANGSIWANIKSIMRQREVVLSTSLYGLNALAVMIYNEIFPLWVVTPPSNGGFSLDSNTIGIIVMFCGILSILLQTTVYPWLAEMLGVLKMFKIGVMMLVFGGLLTPAISTLNILQSKFIVWVSLVFISLLITVSSNWAFISVFVLINNSSYRQQRATVNGLGQTFASLGRLAGPMVGANMFAWSEGNGLRWPLNYYLVFYFVSLICLLSLYVVSLLPRSIERRKREPQNNAFSIRGQSTNAAA